MDDARHGELPCFTSAGRRRFTGCGELVFDASRASRSADSTFHPALAQGMQLVCRPSEVAFDGKKLAAGFC
jgi:hypothetical protein